MTGHRGRRWRLAVRGWGWWCSVLPLARPSKIGVLSRRRSSLDHDAISRPRVARGELGGLEGAKGHEIVDFCKTHPPSAFRDDTGYIYRVKTEAIYLPLSSFNSTAFCCTQLWHSAVMRPTSKLWFWQ